MGGVNAGGLVSGADRTVVAEVAGATRVAAAEAVDGAIAPEGPAAIVADVAEINAAGDCSRRFCFFWGGGELLIIMKACSEQTLLRY